MRARSLLVCFLFATNSYSQFGFIGDSSYKEKYTQVDSLFNLDKSYDFQFRLYSFGTFPPHHSLFILTVKDSIFIARCFKMETIDNKYSWLEIPVSNKDVGALWRSIYNHSVFRRHLLLEFLKVIMRLIWALRMEFHIPLSISAKIRKMVHRGTDVQILCRDFILISKNSNGWLTLSQ